MIIEVDPTGSVEFNQFSYLFMVKKIALVLLVIGGIDMGLIGLFNYDVIATIFGHMTTITRFIYDLVGLSAIYFAFSKSR